MTAFSDFIAGSTGLGGASFHLDSLSAAAAMTYLCCHPIVAFSRRGWHIKKEDVLSSLNTKAKKLYLDNFLKQRAENPEKDFDEMYDRRYGRYRLVVPAILLVIVLLPLSYFITDSAIARVIITNCKDASCSEASRFLMLPAKAIAAFTGAYLWVVYGLIQGAARYNMPPALLMSSVLRLVIAAPLGYAITALVEPVLGVFLAFAIGAFPLPTIKTLLQRTATTKLNLNMGVNPDNPQDDQVIKLDGIDPAVADILQDAEITTIVQLAYCDPVQLSMRTNLGFDALLDLVNQALAWIYLDDHMPKIRPYGMRGASEPGFPR